MSVFAVVDRNLFSRVHDDFLSLKEGSDLVAGPSSSTTACGVTFKAFRSSGNRWILDCKSLALA